MKINKFLLPVLVVAGLAIYLSLFTVKEINQAIVLQFGDPKKVIAEPGLQVKIPFIQNVVFLDRRILSLDPAPEEVIASDQKRLIVDAYARFKIIDPLKFYISVGFEIIIIKSLQGLALDIWEGFHALLVTGDYMDIFKPGYIASLDGCFQFLCSLVAGGRDLRLALHVFGGWDV